MAESNRLVFGISFGLDSTDRCIRTRTMFPGMTSLPLLGRWRFRPTSPSADYFFLLGAPLDFCFWWACSCDCLLTRDRSALPRLLGSSGIVHLRNRRCTQSAKYEDRDYAVRAMPGPHQWSVEARSSVNLCGSVRQKHWHRLLFHVCEEASCELQRRSGQNC